jgi:hypothetical protein
MFGLGPPELGGTPVPDEEEINWLLDAPWAKLALLITVAVVVMVLANMLMRSRQARRGRRPPDFDLRVAKLEALPVAPIASAKSGAVHLIGTLRKGAGALGTGEHACVFRNRSGSSRATAIAAELVLLTDESGTVGLEELESARVIAPKEDQGSHDTIALYLGDRVEVVGELVLFDTPQTADGEPMRGMLGSLGQIQVRVIERPSAGAPRVDSPQPSQPELTPDSSEIQ